MFEEYYYLTQMPEKIVIHWDLHDRENKLLSSWKSYNHTAKKEANSDR